MVSASHFLDLVAFVSRLHSQVINVTSLIFKSNAHHQPMHLTHEMILCLLMTRGRVDITGDSVVKRPC